MWNRTKVPTQTFYYELWAFQAVSQLLGSTLQISHLFLKTLQVLFPTQFENGKPLCFEGCNQPVTWCCFLSHAMSALGNSPFFLGLYMLVACCLEDHLFKNNTIFSNLSYRTVLSHSRYLLMYMKPHQNMICFAIHD